MQGLRLPDTILGELPGGVPVDDEDGTISIRPGDGSSNSVLIEQGGGGPTWHGYVEHGVWTAC